MRFVETPLQGVYVVEQEAARDTRGAFARTFCGREYTDRGLDGRVAQISVSTNTARGTLRGLHFQAAPHEEAKTVRCLSGAVFDVVVDLRTDSPTRRRWFGVELTPRAGNALYIPAGCAHGFVTLEADTSLEYVISTFYVPEAARGFRWDDPTIGIDWPVPPAVVSDRDRALPLLPPELP